MTNWKKLVQWNTDVWAAQDDEMCIVCLTGKEKYLLGQALEQMRWSSRWEADIVAVPDIKALADDLEGKMSCQDTCVEAIQTLIDNAVRDQTGYGDPGEDGETPKILDENPTIAYNCDLDALFAACTTVIDLFNTITIDILQKIEQASNNLEAAIQATDAIPILENLNEPLEFANWLQEVVQENYLAEYTAVLRDDLRCGLFCMAQANCTLTFADIATYMAGLAGQSLFDFSVAQFLNYFTGTTFTGPTIVYAAFWLIAGLMGYGTRVLGLDADRLYKLCLAAMNDIPDPDWAILCVCGYMTPYDFTLGTLGWTPALEAGQTAAYHSAGNGWGHGYYGHICRFEADASAPATINSIRLVHTNMPSLNPQVIVNLKIGGASGTTVWSSGYIDTGAGTDDRVVTPSGVTADYIQVLYVAGIPGNRPTITGYCQQIDISGPGTPAWTI